MLTFANWYVWIAVFIVLFFLLAAIADSYGAFKHLDKKKETAKPEKPAEKTDSKPKQATAIATGNTSGVYSTTSISNHPTNTTLTTTNTTTTATVQHDDFATSMLVAEVTDNTALGYMAGGSFVGAMVGKSIADSEKSHHNHYDDSDNTPSTTSVDVPVSTPAPSTSTDSDVCKPTDMGSSFTNESYAPSNDNNPFSFDNSPSDSSFSSPSSNDY